VGGDESRSRCEKRVNDDVAAIGEIEESVFEPVQSKGLLSTETLPTPGMTFALFAGPYGLVIAIARDNVLQEGL
jgi:hypothetical protein